MRLSIFFLLIALLSSLAAAQPDIRISPPDPPEPWMASDILVQSGARLGDTAIVVWGTTANLDDTAIVNVLQMQLFVDTISHGDRTIITDPQARPYGVVAALGTEDRFFVLWNDKRAGAPGMYLRAISRDGTSGSAELLSAGRLLSADSCRLVRMVNGDLLFIWTDIRSGKSAVYSRLLTPTGEIKGDERKLSDGNVKGVLSTPLLPGAYLVDPNGQAMIITSDGSLLPTRIPGFRLDRAYHINTDGSIAVIRDSVLNIYPSLFDSVAVRSIPLPSIRYALFPYATIRWDSGTYAVTVPLYFTEYAVSFRVRRLYLQPDGEWRDSTLYSRDQKVGYDGFSVAFSLTQPPRIQHGCNGVDQFSMILHANQYYAHGNIYPADFPFYYSVDATGEYQQLQEVARIPDCDIETSPVDVMRVPDSTFSIVDVVLLQDTLVIKKRLSADVAHRRVHYHHTSPSIFVSNDSLAIAWESARPQRTFFLGALDLDRDTVVAPKSFVPIPIPNPYTSVAPFGITAPGGRPIIGTSVYSVSSVGGNYWSNNNSYVLYGAMPNRWLPIKYFTNTSDKTYEYNNDHYAYDPNTNILLGIVSMGSLRTHVFEIDSAGKLIGDYQVQRFGAVAVAGLAEHRWMLIDSVSMNLYDEKELMLSVSLVNAAGSRFMRLLGPYLLRYYPTMGYDSAGHLRDSSVTFELYYLDSLQAGAIRSVVVRPASGMADLAVVQRPSDRSLHLLSGGGDGLHHMVLDSVLHRSDTDSVVSATRGRVAAPSGVFRGDSLYLAWEDYRDDMSVIYGRALGGLALTGDGKGMIENDLQMRVSPTPAREHVAVEFYLRSRGDVEIEIYDSMGRLIVQNVLKSLPVGPGRYEWNCRGIHPGAYFIRLSGPDGAQATRKVIVLD